MSKQVLFRMSECDEKYFSKLLKEKYNVKFIGEESDKKAIVYYDNLLQNKSMKCYIWNEDFSFTPQFQQKNGMYVIVTTGMPVIEYNAFRKIYSNLNTGRIYWDTNDLSGYDSLKFNRWFKECADIIKNNAIYIEKGGGRNIYYWEDYIRSRNIKRSYWKNQNEYLCLNIGINCVNNCMNCVRDECIPLIESDDEIAEKIIGEFNEIYNNETVILGAYSEPLSPDLIKTINKVLYEINGICKKVIIITNGLTYIDFISEYRNLINTVYILYPGSDINEYVACTNSRYGLGAKQIIDRFVNDGKKLGFDIRIERSYRGEVLKNIITC